MVRKFLEKSAVQTFCAVCIWLVVWQLVSVAVGSEIFLVGPFEVLKTLLKLLPTGAFWSTVLFSTLRIIGGFLLAILIGALLAVASSAWTFMRALLKPLMLTVKSVPVASFIILALLWLKNAGNLATFISFLMVLPIVYTSTLAGILSADKKLLEMASVFRIPLRRRVRYLYLPAVQPYFRSACEVGLGLCWKSGVAAEVIGITKGSIGGELYSAKIFLSTAELFAWTLVIVLLSIAFEKLFMRFLTSAERVNLQGGGL